jgi:glycerophosphoryl diester phosphodiesterase
MFWLALFCVVSVALWFYATAKPAPQTALDLPQKNGPLVIAHGDDVGGGLYPGNTLIYLRKMAELGADMLELDLNLSADGHLVLMHDTSVDRTSDGSGAIADLTLEQLRQLNVAYNWSQDGETYPYREQPQRIVTIEETFAELPNFPMIIELKSARPEAAQAMCRAIQNYNKQSQVIVSSFHQPVINEFRKICPHVATGAATADAMLFFAAQLLRAEHLLSPRYQTMQLPMIYHGIKVFSPRLLQAARARGLHMAVWTVNSREDMQRYIDLGVDAILTDRPDNLRALLQAREH